MEIHMLNLTQKEKDYVKSIYNGNGVFRFTAGGHAIDIDGTVFPKGVNVIYLPVHWRASREVANYVHKKFQEQNPHIKINLEYQSGDNNNRE